jgi:hypothetical protein
LLATEHWGLLATRSTAWAEVMSRITIDLTVASAALVVLALVVQSSGFGVAFRVLSIGLCATVLILGSLTALRVVNASRDDAALLAGMNRLRAGYLDIDPSLDRYLVTSWHDDDVGSCKRRRSASPVPASATSSPAPRCSCTPSTRSSPARWAR